MALSESTLKSQIETNINNDAKFKQDIYDVSYDAMEQFQIAQKNAFVQLGAVGNFPITRKTASLAYALKMEALQPVVAEAVAKAVSDAVNTFVKSGDLKVTIPPGAVTTGGGVASVPSPVPIPVTGIVPATGGIT